MPEPTIKRRLIDTYLNLLLRRPKLRRALNLDRVFVLQKHGIPLPNPLHLFIQLFLYAKSHFLLDADQNYGVPLVQFWPRFNERQTQMLQSFYEIRAEVIASSHFGDRVQLGLLRVRNRLQDFAVKV